MKVALDTNVLAYAEGANEGVRKDSALALLKAVRRDRIVLPVQVLGELFNVLVRKAGLGRSASKVIVGNWIEAVHTIETSAAVLAAATDLARDHQLSIWDAIVLAAAAQGGCRLLLSEDMQDGFTWGGVIVTNPFAPRRNEVLAVLLGEDPA